MSVIDLVLGGRVRLRLAGSNQDGYWAVAKQTSLRPAPVEGTADLVVRQVATLHGVNALQMVGLLLPARRRASSCCLHMQALGRSSR